MKLSEIVEYLNLLQKTDLDGYCNTAVSQLEGVNYLVSHHAVQLENFAENLITDLDEVNTAMLRLRQRFGNLKLQLQNLAVQQGLDYYKTSSEVYEHQIRNMTPEHILRRRLRIDDEDNARLRSCIRRYSDWRLPGMIVHPGLETFIEEMVPLDPLYIVDHHEDLIAPSTEKFTPEYRNRLRTYVIDDHVDAQILWRLPDSQFGFVFMYNFLNYKPIQVIEQYLTELIKKLRPGGVAVFTYNECDQAQGVGQVETNLMCYTPGQHLRAIMKDLGFEILFNQVGSGNVSWFEIKKPGEITSLRGGQTLAQILRK